MTHYLLFVISIADHIVRIAGIATRLDEVWMLEIARNLTDGEAGALQAKQFLLIYRIPSIRNRFAG